MFLALVRSRLIKNCISFKKKSTLLVNTNVHFASDSIVDGFGFIIQDSEIEDRSPF